MSAIIVAIEGRDGVGKSTLVANLCKVAGENRVRRRSYPIPSPQAAYYDEIRFMLADGRARSEQKLFTFMQAANRIHWQSTILPEAMGECDLILLDRWHLSNFAYGSALGLDAKWLTMVNRPLTIPHKTFVVDGPRRGEDGDAYEKDDEFQKKVRRAYLDVNDAFVVLEGSQSEGGLTRDAWSVISKLLDRRNKL